MAQASKSYEVKFTGNTTDLSRSFQKLQRDAGVLGKSVSSSSNLMRNALAAVSVGAVVKGLQSATLAASNLSESIAKSNTVFGSNAQAIQAWSQTTARSLGVSQQAALEAAGTYGNLFRAFGINEQESAKMSQALVTLAADLASFNNVPIEDALLALRSGLSGETEPLKRFGVALNDQRLKLKAAELGLGTYTGMLPVAIKTQAAYALIMQDSALAQGDVARTSGGLANQLKFLQAGLEDAKAGFGEALLPAALSVVTAFNEKLLPAIERVVKAIKFQGAEGGLKTIATEISNVITNLDGTAKAVKDVILVFIGIKVVTPLVLALRASWLATKAAIEGTATATKIATGVMKSALASTGIGLLIVGLGAVVAKLIEARVEATALDKEVTFVVQSGQGKWNRYGQHIYGGVTVQLNAASLAATRLSDSVEDSMIKFVKIRNQQGKPVYNPVANPAGDGGGGGGKTAAEKAAEAMAKLVAQSSAAATKALDKMNAALTTARQQLQDARDAYNNYKTSVASAIVSQFSFVSVLSAQEKAQEKLNDKITQSREKLQAAKDAYANYSNGIKEAIISQFSFTSVLTGYTNSQNKAKDAAKKLTDAQIKYGKALKSGDIKSVTEALDELRAAQKENEQASTSKKTFLQVMKEQAAAAVAFANKVKTLISMGLSQGGIDRVIAAGAEAGTAIADELINGGAKAINESNKLLASVSASAKTLGKFGADKFYKAGVEQGEALLKGSLSAFTESDNTKSFLQVMRDQAATVVAFSRKVQKLVSMGLSQAGVDQILAAGVGAGTVIADELIAGGTAAIKETNTLLSTVQNAANKLGTSAADAFYQAGVTQGQALVNGIIASVVAAGFRIVGGAVVLPKALQSALNSGKLNPSQVAELNALLAGVPQLAEGGIVNKPTLALIGEAGPEAVVPLSGRNAPMGNTINLTVNAGMGANGTQIGKDIVAEIKKYERTNGPVFKSA